MKNTYLIIMLLAGFFFNNSNAQNLIPNASFELYDTCPDYLNQVYHCLGWENWLTTPDYYNACAVPGPTTVSVPYNCGPNNFQYAHSGNAYVGYFNYWTRALLSGKPWVRDHIGVQLTQPMQIGVQYYLTMYVSLASWIPSPCASKRVGIKFTTQSFAAYGNTFSSPLVDNTAHIYVDSLITDTLNWTKITGSFVADSAYQYLVIGNFFDDLNTDTLIIGSAPLCYSYYMVDDVCLSSDSNDCIITGVQEAFNDNNFDVYPNPASAAVTIKLPLKINCFAMQLYDGMGRKINTNYEVTNNKNEMIINTANLASGMYHLTVFHDRTVNSIKLIINK